MNYLIACLAGAFLCNAVPHVTSGLQGRPFPTPFARPRGRGDSSPLVNFLWGLANLAAGAALLSRHPAWWGWNGELAAFAVGILIMGTHASLHFGAVQQARQPRKD